ncbi:hypothetical protein QR680_019173 [Steinernema hermaphroditum]|uniref:Protein aurora borealis n=1 Tax=Steinernema hermaphroditum TaxID=289476 RepID=A0AA39LS61_9BILA|nr:hypothetical protein QR680_019173 [Steinernema hermaphroditum]
MTNNTSAEDRYLKNLSTNLVTPGLFRKSKSKLLQTPSSSNDNMGTPRRSVPHTPQGFRWSIEHMAVMCPADIDENAQSNDCPFDDASDADVQKVLDNYWESVHNIMSPDTRKSTRSTTSCASEFDVESSLPGTPVCEGNQRTPKRNILRTPKSALFCTPKSALPRTPQSSSLRTPQSVFRWTIEEMAANCPADIDETEQSQLCPFDDADGDDVQRALDDYWDGAHNVMSPGIRRFMPSPGLSPINRNGAHSAMSPEVRRFMPSPDLSPIKPDDD